MTHSQKQLIAGWLFTGCLLIFLMVVVGGITRLTGSGLSITEWKLIRGTIPPLNESEWNEEFENYKNIPQFKEQNYHFTLHEFKSIYWWEYIHRLIGRIIGLVFIIPFTFFWIKGMINKSLMVKLLLLLGLGALQGFLGWYMVKSGLTENVRVSHIRLAIHLSTAFITFGFTFWLMLGMSYLEKPVDSAVPVRVKKIILFLLLVLFMQIIYGALMAGLKAGHIYNTFPKMGDQWIAESVLFGFKIEGVSALLNNLSVVQFIHRCLGWLLVLSTGCLFFYSRKHLHNTLPKLFLKGTAVLAITVLFQFTLGVLTLLYNVPIVLGILHQTTAFFLFGTALYVLHSCYYDSSGKA